MVQQLGEIHIRMLPNIENRFEKFRPIFNNLHQQGQGKLTENYFCIDSNVVLNHPKTREEIIFSSVQRNSMMKGILFNCFYLTQDDKKEA